MARWTRRSSFAAVVLAALVVTSCMPGAPPAPAAPAAPARPLTIVQSSWPTSMDPTLDATRLSVRIWSHLLESPTKYAWDGKDITLAPSLAESWEQINPTTWRFKLRAGVKFHNGEELTADAMKFSLETFKANRGMSSTLFNHVQQINVVDARTFDVVSEAPFAAMPASMTFLMALPPKYYAESGGKEGFGNKPVGTGPYELASWQKGVEIRLKANQGYWGEKPKIQEVIVKGVPEASSRVAQLETGEADLVAEIPPSLADRVKKIASARAEETAINRRVFLFFNTFEPPTDDVRVRMAINHAVDAAAIIQNLFEGHAAPLKGIYIPGEIGHDPTFPGIPHDPNIARQLLTEAGHPNGLTVDLNHPIGSYTLDKETAEAVQGQLAKVGITARMNGSAVSAFTQQVATQKSPGLNLFSFAPIWFDSSFVMNVHFSSNGLYRYNFEPKQDELIQKALTEQDSKRREQLYRDIERFLALEKVVWVPLYVFQDIYGVSNRLNWSPRPDQIYELDRASFK